MVEKGALDGLVLEVSTLEHHFWAWVNDGRIVYVILILAVLVLFRVSTKRP